MVKKQSNFKDYQYMAVVISLSLVAMLFLIFVALVPSWNKMQKTSAELTSALEKKGLLETRLANLKTLKEKEAELKDQNAKVLAALPQDKDISRLFVEFEGVAAQSGLTVKSVSEGAGNTVAPTAASDLIVPVSYQISATAANYTGLKTALGKFEQALRILTITSLDVTKNANTLNASLVVNAYKRGAK